MSVWPLSTAKASEPFYILAPEAEESASCSDVVKACDKALSDQDRVINLKTKEITVYKEIVAAQDTRIAHLEKEKGGLLRSPWFYLGLGIVAGVLVAK